MTRDTIRAAHDRNCRYGEACLDWRGHFAEMQAESGAPTSPATTTPIDTAELARLRLVNDAARRHAEPGTPLQRTLSAIDRARRTIDEQPDNLALDLDLAIRSVGLAVAVHGDGVAVLAWEKVRDELGRVRVIRELWNRKIVPHGDADYVRAKIYDWPELRTALDALRDGAR